MRLKRSWRLSNLQPWEASNIEYLVLSIRGATPYITVQNALDCEKTLTSAEHDPQTMRPNGLMTVYSATCTMWFLRIFHRSVQKYIDILHIKVNRTPPPSPQGIITTNLWFRYRVRLSCPPNARMVPVMAAGKRFITNKQNKNPINSLWTASNVWWVHWYVCG